MNQVDSYEYRSEILTHGLKRDEWVRIAIALDRDGAIGLHSDISRFIQSHEGEQ